ncbi:MAG: HEPN domain-containing protein [Campylobacteraceae bacterium]|nr:HEPN domain-containing protein [Campylobacteraceae bacterium]
MKDKLINKNDIKSSADMFFYKAIVDLNSAIYLLKAFNENKIEIDIEKIYFDLQQSAEKLLKSILCRKKILFPRSHDLEQLIDICESNGIVLFDEIEILIDLNDYAVEGRYSIIHDDINDSDKYIAVIKKLIKIIEKK